MIGALFSVLFPNLSEFASCPPIAKRQRKTSLRYRSSSRRTNFTARHRLLFPHLAQFAFNPKALSGLGKVLDDIAVKGHVAQKSGKFFFVRPHSRTLALAKQTDKIDRSLLRIADKTITNRALPSRTELIKEAGIMAGEFIKNPLKTIAKGNAREKLIREAVEASTGKALPSNGELLSKAFSKGKTKINQQLSKPEVRKDLAVNTAGVLGSVVGGSVGGYGGKLAGDLGGALIARKGIQDVEATVRAVQKVRTDEAFKSVNALKKIKEVRKVALSELRAPSVGDDYTADIGGWAIGNVTADATLAALPIPLKGATVALPTVPHIVQAKQRILAGESVPTVLRETSQNILSMPKRWIEQGNQREERARQYISKKIRNYKGE